MSNTPNDGGPAFPMRAHSSSTGEQKAPIYGMTLRDYFAAKAMQGMLASGHFTTAAGDGDDSPWIALSTYDPTGEKKCTVTEFCVIEASFRLADAMLAEREKGRE